MTKRQTIKKNFTLALMVLAVSVSACYEKQSNKTTKAMENQKREPGSTKKKVLIIGMDPHTIDFKNPEIPQGLTVDIIEKGTKATLEKLDSLGYDAETFLIKTGSTDLSDLASQVKQKKYDGIVVGNGIRGLNSNFILFEQIVNVIHENAPASRIIFNSLPTNTDEAVKRWL